MAIQNGIGRLLCGCGYLERLKREKQSQRGGENAQKGLIVR